MNKRIIITTDGFHGPALQALLHGIVGHLDYVVEKRVEPLVSRNTCRLLIALEFHSFFFDPSRLQRIHFLALLRRRPPSTQLPPQKGGPEAAARPHGPRRRASFIVDRAGLRRARKIISALE